MLIPFLRKNIYNVKSPNNYLSQWHCPVGAYPQVVFAIAEDVADLQPFDEATGTGDLRYVAVRSAHSTKELMLTFVVTKDLKSDLKQISQQNHDAFQQAADEKNQDPKPKRRMKFLWERSPGEIIQNN